MAQDWLKIKVSNPLEIGKGATINVDLDSVGVIFQSYDKSGQPLVIFGGFPVTKSSLNNDLEWERITRIVNKLPEHKEVKTEAERKEAVMRGDIG